MVGRGSALLAAAVGAAAAVLTVAVTTPAPLAVAATALPAALLVWLAAAVVIAPGLIFVAAAEARGTVAAVGDWLRALPVPTAAKVLAIVVGIAPALESLTGFGVSLVVTVPALLALLPPARALPIALLGMAIMPWGTLGLATLVGAQLANLEPWRLGAATALLSAPVFAVAAVLAVRFAEARHRATAVAALVASLGFASLLTAATLGLGPQVAGALAGTLTAACVLLAARAATLPPAAAWPFALLVALVLALRASAPYLPDWHLAVGDLRLAPLTTPAPALLLAAAAVAGARALPLAGGALVRSARPLLTVLLFVVMAQLAAASGALRPVAALAGDVAGLAVALTALVGGLGGYLTASGIAGNALAMLDAVEQGAVFGQPLLFAAVQNAAAGHAAPGSVPMVALTLAVAGAAHRRLERRLVRFAALWAAGNVALVAAAGVLLLVLSGGEAVGVQLRGSSVGSTYSIPHGP